MSLENTEENFRDSISTINKDGKRVWINPKIPKGKFYDRRKIVSYILLLFLFAAPFVKINGNQFLMFNVMERRFSIFGIPFWPQDFHIFVIIMIIGVVSLALFTVAFGRIFCGWICPQTIFMEMLFRRIEFWIDGDRGAQIRLEKQEWNTEKIRKRVTKYLIFFIISFLIANVFLAYLIGGDTLLQYISEGIAQHTSTLIALLIFTIVFFFVFAWFREQVCIIACPYGRLQGVLLDRKSIIVAYDYVRGEGETGRAKFRKGEDRAAVGKGDCIDCKQCVYVCPTGIDIRNGTQLECINCTACIDECDHMMESVGLPLGLIRYASEDEIVKKEKFAFTTRMKGYAAVLIILFGVFIGMLFLRTDVEATILHAPGQLFMNEGDKIVNLYNYKIINKTERNFDNVTFKLVKPKNGEIKIVGNVVKVKKNGLSQGTLFVKIKASEVKDEKLPLKIAIYNGNELIDTETTNFTGPRSFN